MPAHAGDKPTLLLKKMGGVLLLALGLLLLAFGIREGSTAMTLLGILAAVVGAVLLSLKVTRRNGGGLQ